MLMFEQPVRYDTNNDNNVSFTPFVPQNTNLDNSCERMNNVNQAFDEYYN